MISLYFHIPFCTKKCNYCHFYVLPDKAPLHQQYMRGLKLEWERYVPLLAGKSIATVYFGGGTPALIGPEAIAEILGWVKKDTLLASEDPEITIEANPENIQEALMRGFAEAGINRVSIGVQTLDNLLLKVLGRLHDSRKAIDSIYMVAEAGINNISIDLMYDLPHQNLLSWNNTLNQVSELPITHLSMYNLTIEPHTVFFKYRDQLNKQIPDEESSLRMYEMACDKLESAGLKQYEISAFTKNGKWSRHNVGYWVGRDFLGFGPSAFSHWQGKRFRNIANLSQYVKSLEKNDLPIDFEEKLDEDARRRELLAINLRLIEGVDLQAFQQKFGALNSEDRQALKKMIDMSFLEQKCDRISLTRKGVLFYDSIAEEII